MFDRKVMRKDGGALVEAFLRERPDLVSELGPDTTFPSGIVEDAVSLKFVRPWLAWLDKHGHVDPAKVEAIVKQLAERFPDGWAEAAGPAPEAMPCDVLAVELVVGVTDDQLVDKMRAMKAARESGSARRVVCTVSGFRGDPRELWDVAEVRQLCRRLARTGFISYLDPAAALATPPDPLTAGAFGAMEVWFLGRGAWPGSAAFAALGDPGIEFHVDLLAANAEADRRCGPIGGAA